MKTRTLMLIVVGVMGCSNSDPPPSISGDGQDNPHPEGGVCSKSHEKGCPCDEPGSTAECVQTRTAGDYVSCAPGLRTCSDDGVWGDCFEITVLDSADGGVDASP